MDASVGFIGLGHLGLPVATNLLDAGYALRVYNRTASKADPLVARGAERVERPADAATAGGVVVTLVWDGQALEGVVRSDGFLDRLGSGGIHVSMSTVSPELARDLAALHDAHGSIYLEAPVFGRPEAAAARQLWIPVAGPQDAKARVRPLLQAMGGQGIFDFGEEIGAAVLVKLLGNFLIISAARSLGEALAVAGGYGVDPAAAVEMLTQTLFPAPVYRSYGSRIAGGADPFGQSAIPYKDLGLFMEAAQRADLRTPLAAALRSLVR